MTQNSNPSRSGSSYTMDQFLKVALETIRAAKFCFLVTVNPKWHVSSRLMQPFEPTEDLIVHMGASSDSRKVREILTDNRVMLDYALPEQGAYVTLSGRAQIIRDTIVKRKYWRDSFIEFWPEGPESSGYIIIRFEPQRVEMMNFEKKVVPEPYGLRAAVAHRVPGGWKLEQN